MHLFDWFVCFIFFVPLENFSLLRDVTMTGEGLQILTYARHLWAFSSEGSLACHTYRKTGHLRGPLTLIPTADRLAVLMT